VFVAGVLYVRLNMHTKIRVIPHGIGLINSEENRSIQRWANDAFGDLEVCHAYQYYSGADYCVLSYCEDQFVGFAAVFKREVAIGRRTLNMGCVGGVIISPEYRGKGYGSIIMREIERVIYNTLSCDIGGLLCLKEMRSFYEKLGWTSHTNTVLVEKSGEKVEWSEIFMSHDSTCSITHNTPVDLCGLPW
jgi:GNAT superfamily N-acetyltransferase